MDRCDLAWDHLKTRPDWRKLVKAPEYHESAYLLDGLEDNYREHGVDWPANRYVLIALSGDADVKGRKPMQTGVVHGWRCRYDLQTGKFDAGPFFREQREGHRARVSGAFSGCRN
jgi:hypothetical protein